MSKEKLFLSARWENLLLCTYAVDPAVLAPLMPEGLEADTIDGIGFVSLVAFDFLDTKVKGVKIPFHVNFPEINLRYYVKNSKRRGVVFVQELVPRHAISIVANLVYNEKYRTLPMERNVESSEKIRFYHSLECDGEQYYLKAEMENKPWMPPKESPENFFKEHQWGFVTQKDGTATVYRVEHTEWKVCPVTEFECKFDFGKIYGKHWEMLNNTKPYNLTFALGSPVKVFTSQTL